MHEGKRKKTSLATYLPLTLFVRFEKGYSRFACERVLKTEHKLHILTPLLWPSRCVFPVLLMLGSTPSGVPRPPSVECGIPYHIWSLTLWKSAGNCIGGSEAPLGRVWPALPHMVPTVWNSTGNCIGDFREPPRSGVAFPTASRLSGSLLATALGPKLNWVK